MALKRCLALASSSSLEELLFCDWLSLEELPLDLSSPEETLSLVWVSEEEAGEEEEGITESLCSALDSLSLTLLDSLLFSGTLQEESKAAQENKASSVLLSFLCSIFLLLFDDEGVFAIGEVPLFVFAGHIDLICAFFVYLCLFAIFD